MLRKNSLLILPLLALALIWGCSKEESPPPLVMPQKKKVASVMAKVKEQEIKEPVYSYDPKGRRDPFKSLLLGKTAQKGKELKEELKILGPLQNYDLETLKLVGIVWGEMGNFAIVEAPDGKGYSVYLNTPIGKHNGHIKEITADKIVIGESYVDVSGEKKDREVIMELRKGEG